MMWRAAFCAALLSCHPVATTAQTPSARAEASDAAAARRALDGVTAAQWSVESNGDLVRRLTGEARITDYRAAAEAGDARAQWLLGATPGVLGQAQVSVDEAIRWLEQSAAQNDARGLVSLAIYRRQTGAFAEALALLRRADPDNAVGQATLALDYLIGWTEPRDPARAFALARRSAERGSVDGQSILGQLYARGFGVARDDAEALRWYRLAAARGNNAAQAFIGGHYLEGRGVAQDYAEALHWFRLAADQGGAAGEIGLAILYANGWGVRRDDAEAARLYRLAADRGNPGAQAGLGRLYAEGRGVPRDDDEARRWMGLAAAGGDEEARAWLAANPAR
jgi:hypothetical protein